MSRRDRDERVTSSHLPQSGWCTDVTSLSLVDPHVSPNLLVCGSLGRPAFAFSSCQTTSSSLPQHTTYNPHHSNHTTKKRRPHTMKLSLTLLALVAGAQCNSWFGNAGKLPNLDPALTPPHIHPSNTLPTPFFGTFPTLRLTYTRPYSVQQVARDRARAMALRPQHPLPHPRRPQGPRGPGQEQLGGQRRQALQRLGYPASAELSDFAGQGDQEGHREEQG